LINNPKINQAFILSSKKFNNNKQIDSSLKGNFKLSIKVNSIKNNYNQSRFAISDIMDEEVYLQSFFGVQQSNLDEY